MITIHVVDECAILKLAFNHCRERNMEAKVKPGLQINETALQKKVVCIQNKYIMTA